MSLDKERRNEYIDLINKYMEFLPYILFKLKYDMSFYYEEICLLDAFDEYYFKLDALMELDND